MEFHAPNVGKYYTTNFNAYWLVVNLFWKADMAHGWYAGIHNDHVRLIAFSYSMDYNILFTASQKHKIWNAIQGMNVE